MAVGHGRVSLSLRKAVVGALRDKAAPVPTQFAAGATYFHSLQCTFGETFAFDGARTGNFSIKQPSTASESTTLHYNLKLL